MPNMEMKGLTLTQDLTLTFLNLAIARDRLELSTRKSQIAKPVGWGFGSRSYGLNPGISKIFNGLKHIL